MKKYSKIFLMLSFGTFLLSSCHMDLEPASAEVYKPETEELIKDGDELVYFVNGLYSSFRSTQYGSATMPSEIMCDGFNATVSYGNNMGAIHRTDYTFLPTNEDTGYLWEINYTAIKNYNVFIEAASVYQPQDNNERFYQQVGIAEAKFFRAFAYLTLVRAFAKPYGDNAATDPGVPLVLKYDQDEKPARSSVAAVYTQIKKDLDEAYAVIVNTYGIGGEARSEWVTEDAINALYARYYLDTKQYAQAAAKAAEVISTGNYELASDAQTMVQEYTYDNGSEPIMQLAGQLSENGGGSNTYYTLTSYNAGYVGYSTTGMYFSPYYVPSGKLYSLYDTSDLRRVFWFWNGTKSTDQQYFLLLDYVWRVNNAAFFPVFIKYLGNPELSSSSVPNGRQLIKPLLIGEQYLIAAEAYLAAGDATNAANYLNELQAYRGATETTATEENIQDEWFKETIGEGLRMSCLKRWGTGYDGRAAMTYHAYYNCYDGANFTEKSMPANDPHWQWPIPSWDVKTNPNIVQNPGY